MDSQEIKTVFFKKYAGACTHLEVTKRVIVAAFFEGQIGIWDRKTLAPLEAPPASNQNSICNVKVNREDVVIGYRTGKILIWNLRRKKSYMRKSLVPKL